VERAKLGMLMEDRTSISVENLTASAVGMKHHMALLNPPEDEQTPAEAFYGAFKGMVTEAISAESFDDLATADGVTAARNTVIQHVTKLRQHSEGIASVIVAGAGAAAAAA